MKDNKHLIAISALLFICVNSNAYTLKTDMAKNINKQINKEFNDCIKEGSISVLMCHKLKNIQKYRLESIEREQRSIDSNNKIKKVKKVKLSKQEKLKNEKYEKCTDKAYSIEDYNNCRNILYPPTKKQIEEFKINKLKQIKELRNNE